MKEVKRRDSSLEALSTTPGKIFLYILKVKGECDKNRTFKCRRHFKFRRTLECDSINSSLTSYVHEV